MVGPREFPFDPDPYVSTRVSYSEASAWAGWLLFAAVLLVMLGAFQATVGFIALFKDGIFVAHRNGQLIPIDYTTWGWIHLLLAAIALVAGVGLLLGQLWARIVGVVLAIVNTLILFTFLDAYPWLSTIMIAFSLITVYAIVVHGREVADAYDR